MKQVNIRKWGEKAWVKAFAFVLAAAMFPVMLGCMAVLHATVGNGWYGYVNVEPDIWQGILVRHAVRDQARKVMGYQNTADGVVFEDTRLIDPDETNYRFRLYDRNGGLLFSNVKAGDYHYVQHVQRFGGQGSQGYVDSYVSTELAAWDSIYIAYQLTEDAYILRTPALLTLIVSGCVLLLLLAYLARSAGRRAGSGTVVTGWPERIPLELYLSFDFLALCGIRIFFFVCVYHCYPWTLPLFFTGWAGCAFLAGIVLLALWATLCVRVKSGQWRESILCYRFLRRVWRMPGRIARHVPAVLGSIPAVWRTALFLMVLTALEFAAIFLYSAPSFMLLWVLEKLILIPLMLYIALALRTLQKAGERLAAGDMTAKVDTRYLFWEFRRHGEALNAISQGIAVAVEREMKSERLRTELITNVSHDIRTPLTGIVSYVGLLRGDTAGEHTAEYLDVLDRQSRRLRRLTEDLLELSRASAGNIPVHASRRSVSELLLQAAGEYSDRLEAAGLETVLTVPPSGEPLYACVDGNLLWRAMDNLFSNARKYAQPGTRFYIDADTAPDGQIRLTFRNTSREPLNVPAEELLERFVRGDRARSGEGSGLGLNIAQSLVELQAGGFALSVDGDLFKVELTLPAVP